MFILASIKAERNIYIVLTPKRGQNRDYKKKVWKWNTDGKKLQKWELMKCDKKQLSVSL